MVGGADAEVGAEVEVEVEVGTAGRCGKNISLTADYFRQPPK